MFRDNIQFISIYDDEKYRQFSYMMSGGGGTFKNCNM